MIIDTEVALRIALQSDSEDEHLEFKAAHNNYNFINCCVIVQRFPTKAVGISF